MTKRKRNNKGWYNDPDRHALASKGVETAFENNHRNDYHLSLKEVLKKNLHKFGGEMIDFKDVELKKIDEEYYDNEFEKGYIIEFDTEYMGTSFILKLRYLFDKDNNIDFYYWLTLDSEKKGYPYIDKGETYNLDIEQYNVFEEFLYDNIKESEWIEIYDKFYEDLVHKHT